MILSSRSCRQGACKFRRGRKCISADTFRVYDSHVDARSLPKTAAATAAADRDRENATWTGRSSRNQANSDGAQRGVPRIPAEWRRGLRAPKPPASGRVLKSSLNETDPRGLL